MTKSERHGKTPVFPAFRAPCPKLRRLNADGGAADQAALGLVAPIASKAPRGSIPATPPRTPPKPAPSRSPRVAHGPVEKTEGSLPTLFGIDLGLEPATMIIGRGIMGPIGGAMAAAIFLGIRARDRKVIL